MQTRLRVGGFTPLSTSDWPGRLVAVVFCQGCPWRCRYCHNPDLLPRHGPATVRWEDIAGFLERRRGLLDGVVFSGGEPTLQPALPAAMRAVRDLGFQVGLHTAGIYPRRLQAVLSLVDWVGLDVKAPLASYDRITGAPGSGERVRQSLAQVLAAGVDYEIRTTVHPALLSEADLSKLTAYLASQGVKRHVIQAFRSQGCRDAGLLATACGPSVQGQRHPAGPAPRALG